MRNAYLHAIRGCPELSELLKEGKNRWLSRIIRIIRIIKNRWLSQIIRIIRIIKEEREKNIEYLAWPSRLGEQGISNYEGTKRTQSRRI